MSAQSRKLFVNVTSFIVLLITWWVVGSSVADTAVNMDDKFFNDSTIFLRGAYLNDWLPVFAAAAFGLGWGVAAFVTGLVKSKSQMFPVLLSLYSIPAIIGFAIYVSIDKVQYSVTAELFRLMLMLFLPGCVFGSVFGVLRRFDNGEFA